MNKSLSIFPEKFNLNKRPSSSQSIKKNQNLWVIFSVDTVAILSDDWRLPLGWNGVLEKQHYTQFTF